MIIYGSRMYFKDRVVNSFAECDHCGRYGRMTSYQAKKFGHIYFIPLIPMGEKSQVLRECGSCSIELATLYERANNYAKIVESYDKLYSMKPELIGNAGMQKLYKKACKKSGVAGKFLGQMK